MKTRIISCLLPVLVMIAPPAWASSGPDETSRRIALDVDTLGLGPDLGPRIEMQVYEPLRALLERQDFEVEGPGGATPTVLVTLGFLDEARVDYAIHIDLVEQHESSALAEWFVCMACTERRLVEQTLAGFETAVAALVEHDEAEPAVQPPAPVQPPAKPAPIGPLGYLGAGVGGGGLVMLAIGIGLLETSKHTGKPTGSFRSPYRPGAELVFGIGVTTVGLGVLAVATDLIGRRVAAKRSLRPEFSLSSTRMSVGVSFDF